MADPSECCGSKSRLEYHRLCLVMHDAASKQGAAELTLVRPVPTYCDAGGKLVQERQGNGERSLLLVSEQKAISNMLGALFIAMYAKWVNLGTCGAKTFGTFQQQVTNRVAIFLGVFFGQTRASCGNTSSAART